VRAAEYALASRAHYQVLPEEGRIEVDVEVTFENTTPDPSGQFSVFEVVDLAVQDQATDISATDDEGDLNVSVGTREGTHVVSVRPRSEVRYGEETTFTLQYVLPDGDAGALRVRPSVVIFPAWGFGTSARVTVTLPSSFEVAVDGDELTAKRDGNAWELDSGRINDPTRWLAVVTATRPATFLTLSEGVPLSSGTVDLQVRAWEDDRAWGARTLALLADALPLLEEEIGLEYPQVGPLVVVESVAGPETGFGEPEPGEAEIAAAFDEPPFTLVHQAAHVWFRAELAGERWIREGFASYAAASIADALDVDPPFDPAAETEGLEDDAFPLVSWGQGEASAEQDRYAYAASWQTANRIASTVGADATRAAWQRIAAGIGAYEPMGAASLTDDATLTPIGSRELLDQLQAVSNADPSPVFAGLVFDDETAALLEPRAEAREAFTRLLTVAGSWGAPDPIKAALGGWSFDEAGQQIEEAVAWLEDRDALLSRADEAGLTVPQRLRDRYVTAGGGADARAELDAEIAVVDDYLEVVDRLAEERSILERVGLLGGRPEPSELMADAATQFAEGDLRGAAESIEAARARLDAAAVDGAVRIASVVAVVLLVVVLIVWILRRRSRTDSDYTAAP
jgi:hypothetical protein